MKNILIISPHFPPVNAADMHRVRHNVHYFKELRWQATVMCVNPKYVEAELDHQLKIDVYDSMEIVYVKALPVSITRKFGLGSLALRSMIFYWCKVNQLLKKKSYDLIFFSTTQFPLLILGPYWKWRFKIPYVIDMQDPWYNTYYHDKPKHQRPKKYWFSSRLNKWLEPMVMRHASGIVSVSQGYIDQLSNRYANITAKNSVVIPFGAFEKDFENLPITQDLLSTFADTAIEINYIGRGGYDMHRALRIVFQAFQIGLSKDKALFSTLRFNFYGTSYAAKGKGEKTIENLAEQYHIKNYVFEFTDRIPYFEALHKLVHSHALLVPGSDDPNYTASKIYPYILAKRPLLAIFHESSSLKRVFSETNAGQFICFSDHTQDKDLVHYALQWLELVASKKLQMPNTNWEAFKPYTAKAMTEKLVAFFEQILRNETV